MRFFMFLYTEKESGDEENSQAQVKHIVECKRQLVQDFIRKHFVSRGRKCQLCHTFLRELRGEHNIRILTKVPGKQGAPMQMVYFSPEDAKQHLRNLMKNEGEDTFLLLSFKLKYFFLFETELQIIGEMKSIIECRSGKVIMLIEHSVF